MIRVFAMGTACVVLALAACGCAKGSGGSGIDGTGGMVGYPIVLLPTSSSSSESAGGAPSSSSTSTGGSTSTGQADLSALCKGTWGTAVQEQCCMSEGSWPDTCNQPHCGGVLTCSDGINGDTPYCQCPIGQCFDRSAGCVDAV